MNVICNKVGHDSLGMFDVLLSLNFEALHFFVYIYIFFSMPFCERV